MFIVICQLKGEANCQRRYYGPFTYDEAEDWLCQLPPAIDCECKYIDELIMPKVLPIVMGASLH